MTSLLAFRPLFAPGPVTGAEAALLLGSLAAALAPSRPGVDAAEWKVMYDAIRARLRRSVEAALHAPVARAEPAAEGAALGDALDCVDALDKLDAMFDTMVAAPGLFLPGDPTPS